MKLLHSHFHSGYQILNTGLLLACILLLFLSTLGPLSIEIGTIDISLQTFFIMLTCLFFRPLPSLLLICVYLILGLAGLPVFSSYSQGIGPFTSPSGIFLFLFPAFAYIFSYWVKSGHNSFTRILFLACVAQILLLIAGFGWIINIYGMSITDAANNILVLIPGLIIKAVSVALFNHLLLRRFFGTNMLH